MAVQASEPWSFREKEKEAAILLVAFGTSTKARETYGHFEGLVRREFPGYEIRWAYTAESIRERLMREEGVKLYGVQEALIALRRDGYRKVAMQSLHVIPGWEFHRMLEQAQVEGVRVEVGLPLLSHHGDYERIVEALRDEFPSPEWGCAVLVVHGTRHPAMACYAALDRLLRDRYDNVFVGAMEGYPTREGVMRMVKAHKGKRVRFIPFMFVAGEHILNGVMGDQEVDGKKTWKMVVAESGITPYCSMKGLGFNEGIVEVYLEHLRGALRDLEN